MDAVGVFAERLTAEVAQCLPECRTSAVGVPMVDRRAVTASLNDVIGRVEASATEGAPAKDVDMVADAPSAGGMRTHEHREYSCENTLFTHTHTHTHTHTRTHHILKRTHYCAADPLVGEVAATAAAAVGEESEHAAPANGASSSSPPVCSSDTKSILKSLFKFLLNVIQMPGFATTIRSVGF